MCLSLTKWSLSTYWPYFEFFSFVGFFVVIHISLNDFKRYLGYFVTLSLSFISSCMYASRAFLVTPDKSFLASRYLKHWNIFVGSETLNKCSAYGILWDYSFLVGVVFLSSFTLLWVSTLSMFPSVRAYLNNSSTSSSPFVYPFLLSSNTLSFSLLLTRSPSASFSLSFSYISS